MHEENTFDFAPLSVGTMRIGDWGAKMNTKESEAVMDGCLELWYTDYDSADFDGG